MSSIIVQLPFIGWYYRLFDSILEDTVKSIGENSCFLLLCLGASSDACTAYLDKSMFDIISSSLLAFLIFAGFIFIFLTIYT